MNTGLKHSDFEKATNRQTIQYTTTRLTQSTPPAAPAGIPKETKIYPK